MQTTPVRVAIAGLGALGRPIALSLSEGLPGYRLAAVSARNRDRAAEFLSAHGIDVPVVSLAGLEPYADIVIDCTPAACLPEVALPVLKAGKEVIVLSAGALLDEPGLIALAEENGGTITVPTGALLGLDAVTAAAEGRIHSVRIVSAKPPAGLAGAPHLGSSGLRLEDIKERQQLFAGTAREAARGFPANLNVAVALALAGIGPDRTEVEVWVDPGLSRNTHVIELDSDSARLVMQIENIPTGNPRTGRITAQSVISLLRKRTAPLRVGS